MGVANNFGCFFLSGLPGGLDYAMLVMVCTPSPQQPQNPKPLVLFSLSRLVAFCNRVVTARPAGARGSHGRVSGEIIFLTHQPLAAGSTHVHVRPAPFRNGIFVLIIWRETRRYPFVAWQCWSAGNVSSGYGTAVTVFLVVVVASLHFFNGEVA